MYSEGRQASIDNFSDEASTFTIKSYAISPHEDNFDFKRFSTDRSNGSLFLTPMGTTPDGAGNITGDILHSSMSVNIGSRRDIDVDAADDDDGDDSDSDNQVVKDMNETDDNENQENDDYDDDHDKSTFIQGVDDKIEKDEKDVLDVLNVKTTTEGNQARLPKKMTKDAYL